MGIAQHHDAVSVTEKQHVANDYAKRLSIGYKKAENVVVTSLACMAESASESICKNVVTNFEQCPLLNISYCPATEVNLSPGKKLVIREDVTVQDSSGKEIESQILPVLDTSVALRKFYVTAHAGKTPSSGPLYWLAFTAEVPPLGFNTYIITSGKAAGRAVASVRQSLYKFDGSQNDAVEVGPGNLKLIYSEGKLTQYVNSRNLVKFSLGQSYGYYTGDDGSKDTVQPQASVAYIFRPNGTFPLQSQRKIPLTVLRGPLFGQFIKLLLHGYIRLTHQLTEHAEVEFIVGPVPIDDGIGKEIVTQLRTTINSNRTFYTDSNGRDFLERIRDYKADWNLQVHQPVAGNYYLLEDFLHCKCKEIRRENAFSVGEEYFYCFLAEMGDLS